MYKLLILIIALFSLTACGRGTNNKASNTGSNRPLNIGLLSSTGGIGDRSFNDASLSGILRAEVEHGITFDFSQPLTDDDIFPMLLEMVESNQFDLIFVMAAGNAQKEAIEYVNANFPSQKISHVDSSLELPNVSGLQTKWQEQTFLTGIMAGLGTLSDMPLANPDQNKLGMIIGTDIPIMRQGLLGFMAGARLVNPDVEMIYDFTESFTDKEIAYDMSMDMFDTGIDFILTITAAAGRGVYSASRDAMRYSFASGASQNFIEPDHIVATAYRNVAELVFNEIDALTQGTWQDGLHLSGLLQESVGFDVFQSNVVIPDVIMDAVYLALEMVMDGEMVVVSEFDDLEDWLLTYQPYFEHFIPLLQLPTVIEE